MRIWEPHLIVMLILNCGLWPLIHISVVYGCLKLHNTFLQKKRFIQSIYSWEKDGTIYEKLFRVRSWKEKLPDGGVFFSTGFRKKRLAKKDSDYLWQFLLEINRGEWTHAITFWFFLLFFLFNPPWAGWVMMVYSMILNIPCVIVQRYNRIRITKILERQAKRVEYKRTHQVVHL